MKTEIFNLINACSKILILTHENPDGDAVGSAMAIYDWLSKLQKKVTLVIPELPPLFLYLNNINVISKISDERFDLAIVVDTSNIERIGQNNNEFSRCDKSIVIDHHISNNNFGTFNFIDELAPSCTQVIYYLFKEWLVEFSYDIGVCLLTGCMTDTNGFSNDDVNKETFLMVAELMDLGVSVHQLYYDLLKKKSMAQHELMNMTIQRLEFFGDGKIVFSYISKEDMENVGAKKGDHEGLVELGRNIIGVEVAIFMREDDDGYNVSFRSNGFDVSKLALKFNGGGHKVAAGAKLQMTFKAAKEVLIKETLKELKIDGWNYSN